jgi:hypothetical protein
MNYVYQVLNLFSNLKLITMPAKSTKKTATKSAKKTTTKPGKLSTAEKDKLPNKTYAFPAKRKEPLEDASHVRNAMARFNQVKDVTDEERKEAFANIKKAAKKFGVEVNEKDWKELADKK